MKTRRGQGHIAPLRHALLWLRRFPRPSEALSFGDLVRSHLARNAISILDRGGAATAAAGTGEIEPHVRLNVVLRNAPALVIHHAETGLCNCVSLLRRAIDAFDARACPMQDQRHYSAGRFLVLTSRRPAER
jgi:hypothetical protein